MPDGRREKCKDCVRIYQQNLRVNPPQKSVNTKKCPACGLVKSRDEFGLRSNGKWLRSHCRECETQKFADWHQNNRHKAAENNRKTNLKKYGLTEREYDEILFRQNGVCVICGNKQNHGRKKNLCVDHNHETGAVRGLLCDSCNRAIGLVKDSVEKLQKMISYLQSYQ